MSTATIEELQKIVADENRPTEEREAAAKHILTLQGKPVELTEQDRTAAYIEGLKAEWAKRMARDLDAEERERKDAINRVEKACPVCYRRQAFEKLACELCGSEPEKWLPSEDYDLRKDSRGNVIDEQGNIVVPLSRQVGLMQRALDDDRWRKWSATSASGSELRNVVARISSPDDFWKVLHAAKILRLRGEMVPATFHGDDVSAEPVKPIETKPVPTKGITDSQVQSAIRLCEIREAQIARELEELRAKSGQSDNAEAPSAPWDQEPGYVEEKLRREALATGNAIVPADPRSL